MEWQPIESAPRDGTWVLAYNPVCGVYKTRFLDGQWPMNGWDDKEGTWYPAPYWWMPLPTLPDEWPCRITTPTTTINAHLAQGALEE
jgi:hypothetical protein